MSLISLFALLILFAIAWLILDTATARDVARQFARHHCRDLGVQFLDQTVELARTRVARGVEGSLCLERYFRFEFSETGGERCPGSVRLLGRRPRELTLSGEQIGQVVIGRQS